MLYGQKTVESETSYAQPETTTIVEPGASTQDMTGTVHALTAQVGLTVIDLRADVADGRVALWVHNGQSEVSVGELDTIQITGPSAAEAVELHIADITSGGTAAYKVSGNNEAGCRLGPWPRNETDTGIRCVLAMPANSTQASWIKFTIGAEPLQGQPVPAALDPLGVVQKDG